MLQGKDGSGLVIMRNRPSICLLLVIMTALIISAPRSFAHAKGIKAMVIVSSQIRPYVSALNGFKHAFQDGVEIFDLSKNPQFVRYTLVKEKFDLYTAIGPKATQLLWEVKPQGIKLTLMVLDPESIIQKKQACGIKLRIPIEEQLGAIKTRIGPAKGIGLLYTPGENSLLVSKAMASAKELSLVIKAYPVENAPEIKKTLPELYQQCDTLLFIPDPTVISEPMVKFIIKDAILHGISSVGYNRFFFDAGAVMAFVVDYEKLGALAAEMALKAMETGKCELAPPPYEILWNKRAWKFLQKIRRQKGIQK